LDTKKPYSITTEKEINRARTQLVFWLSWEVAKYGLMKKLIEEFTRRGIFEQHKDYIRDWLTYIDQQKFSKKLETQLLNEIRRYIETRDERIKEKIIEIIWNETGTEAWIKGGK